VVTFALAVFATYRLYQSGVSVGDVKAFVDSTVRDAIGEAVGRLQRGYALLMQ
jgi:hypothetical protein